MKAQILIFDGFDELDAIGPYEVFQNARDSGADLETQLVTLDGATEVTASHGLQIRPQGTLATDSGLDLLIVPGGGWGDRAERGAWAEVQRGDIPAALARLHQSGTTLASVCTGGMLLAASGLLKGRPAIAHQVAIADLQAAGAIVTQARVVDDGDIVSSGGVTSGIDLALWLVERFFGRSIAQAVETELEYQRSGSLWRRSIK